MAQENKFLTIPAQGGLFVPVRKERSAEMDDDDEDDNGDEEEEDVRLIPRCSPVPRKRGHSLADETAEYMRIRLALPRRRVSFADASGGELVDVRQFVPFDSDEEEEDSRWEEEEAKYRKAYRQPNYRVRPDFQSLSSGDLEHAVRARKVEVEGVQEVSDEPLSFDVLIRVLNVSFHKSVYVRSTMDGWITYFDYPAEYVHGPGDGDTDSFCVRLSFAEPYLFDGARIDFVVRYETADGEFWANNMGRNYSVTLQVSYEEETGQASKVEEAELRGILKPPRYRMEDENELFQYKDEGDVDTTEEEAAVAVPCVACPLVIEPEIDIEVSEALSISPPNTSRDTTPAECTLPSIEDSSDKQPLQESPAIPLQTDHPGTTGQATESLSLTVSIQQPEEAQLEVPDNDQLPHSERPQVRVTVVSEDDIEGSAEPNKSFSPNQDDSQLDISAQVPFDLDITPSAIYPCIPRVEEHKSEELKEEGEAEEEIKSETVESETPRQSQTIYQVDETESSLQVQHETVWTCSFSNMGIGSASQDEGDHSYRIFQDAKPPGSESLLVKEPEMQTAEYDGKSETSRDKGAGLRVEKTQTGEKDVPDITATHLGPTEDDIVTQSLQSLPTTSDPKVSVHHQERPEQGPDLKELEDADTSPASESGPVLTSVCKSDTSPDFTAGVEVVSPEDKDRDLCSVEEPVTHKEFESFHEDLSPLQTQDGLESQLPLPSESLEDPSAEPEVALGQTLILSFAFLSAAICLVVGLQDASVFLVMGLFLVSLCF
ncbi:uncharacterized protein [Salminus brasiliensis]|uniref:uncharacterized protein n=1 Tax=Salminus brasiliensis TaxID=930266 RepID=UPI003B831FE2